MNIILAQELTDSKIKSIDFDTFGIMHEVCLANMESHWTFQKNNVISLAHWFRIDFKDTKTENLVVAYKKLEQYFIKCEDYFNEPTKDIVFLEDKKELVQKMLSYVRLELASLNKESETNQDKKNKQTNANPIKWLGTPGQLVFLFDELKAKGFLPISMNLQAEIKKHFINVDGKPYNNLKSPKQNYLESKTGKPKKADEIENVIKSASKNH
jgi:hypothetical protein